jgi:hypothetical protein
MAARGTIVGQLQKICAALPECVLEPSPHGDHHTLRVRGKTMGWYMVDHHGDGRVSLAVRAPKGDNVALVASDPVKFFMPQYVAHHGYMGMHLDLGEIDWDEVREFVVDAYRLVAPKSLAKLVD